MTMRSIALWLGATLGLTGCALGQYRFNGRDALADRDASTEASIPRDGGALDVSSADVEPTRDALEVRMDGGGDALEVLDAPADAFAGTDASTSDRSVTDAAAACDSAEPVPADAVFVSPSGSPSADGSASNPFATVSAAVSAVERGGSDRPIVPAP